MVRHILGLGRNRHFTGSTELSPFIIIASMTRDQPPIFFGYTSFSNFKSFAASSASPNPDITLYGSLMQSQVNDSTFRFSSIYFCRVLSSASSSEFLLKKALPVFQSMFVPFTVICLARLFLVRSFLHQSRIFIMCFRRLLKISFNSSKLLSCWHGINFRYCTHASVCMNRHLVMYALSSVTPSSLLTP